LHKMTPKTAEVTIDIEKLPSVRTLERKQSSIFARELRRKRITELKEEPMNALKSAIYLPVLPFAQLRRSRKKVG
jgi:hypothetical protein